MPKPEPDPAAVPAAWLLPRFSSPHVRALMSTREGGVSVGPFASLNLRDGLGDDPAAVRENRRRWRDALGMPMVRVNQVHGAQVATLDEGMVDEPPVTADASVTTRPGLACEIQVADCLPVLLADRHGRGVAAAHAGWRGLAGGVLEAALAALCRGAGTVPGDVEAWLGPCIGPESFEVGVDVLQAFDATPAVPGPRFRALREGKWLADLPGLARDRLVRAGLAALSGNDGQQSWCTVSNPARYFSYRRDGTTGRMAACIALAAAA